MTIMKIPIIYEVEGIPSRCRKSKTFKVFDSIYVEIPDATDVKLVSVSGIHHTNEILKNAGIEFDGYRELYNVDDMLYAPNISTKRIPYEQTSFDGQKGPHTLTIDDITKQTDEWISKIPSLKTDARTMMQFKISNEPRLSQGPKFLLNFGPLNIFTRHCFEGDIANLDDVEQFKTITSDTRDAVIAKTRQAIRDMKIMAYDGKIFFPTTVPKYGLWHTQHRIAGNKINRFSIMSPESNVTLKFGLPLTMIDQQNTLKSSMIGDIIGNVVKISPTLFREMQRHIPQQGPSTYNLDDITSKSPELTEFLRKHGSKFIGILDTTDSLKTEILDMDFLMKYTSEQDVIDTCIYAIKSYGEKLPDDVIEKIKTMNKTKESIQAIIDDIYISTQKCPSDIKNHCIIYFNQIEKLINLLKDSHQHIYG